MPLRNVQRGGLKEESTRIFRPLKERFYFFDRVFKFSSVSLRIELIFFCWCIFCFNFRDTLSLKYMYDHYILCISQRKNFLDSVWRKTRASGTRDLTKGTCYLSHWHVQNDISHVPLAHTVLPNFVAFMVTSVLQM